MSANLQPASFAHACLVPPGPLHLPPVVQEPHHTNLLPGAFHSPHSPGITSMAGLPAHRPMPRHGASLASQLPGFMAQALDEMDYAVVLVDDTLRVLHANHQARLELTDPHPLQLQHTQLHLPRPLDQRMLLEVAQAATQRGIRRLIHVGDGSQRVGISVVPLCLDGSWRAPALMLALGRQQVCANLTVQGFARLHKLSPMECLVLDGLCRSVSPAEIARHNGVALSTVRTQITNIRIKTSTASIRDLVHQISMLPPLIGALRQTCFRPEAGNAVLAGAHAGRAA